MRPVPKAATPVFGQKPAPPSGIENKPAHEDARVEGLDMNMRRRHPSKGQAQKEENGRQADPDQDGLDQVKVDQPQHSKALIRARHSDPLQNKPEKIPMGIKRKAFFNL